MAKIKRSSFPATERGDFEYFLAKNKCTSDRFNNKHDYLVRAKDLKKEFDTRVTSYDRRLAKRAVSNNKTKRGIEMQITFGGTMNRKRNVTANSLHLPW